MKKVISGCISLLLVSLCVGAFGEAPRYTLADLREQAAEGWHETYEAYGRTVRIDLDDFVPQAEAAPVLLCGRHALPPEAKRDELAKKYRVNVEDPKSSTFFKLERNMGQLFLECAILLHWMERAERRCLIHVGRSAHRHSMIGTRPTRTTTR